MSTKPNPIPRAPSASQGKERDLGVSDQSSAPAPVKGRGNTVPTWRTYQVPYHPANRRHKNWRAPFKECHNTTVSCDTAKKNAPPISCQSHQPFHMAFITGTHRKPLKTHGGGPAAGCLRGSPPSSILLSASSPPRCPPIRHGICHGRTDIVRVK